MLASSRDPYGIGFREVEIVEEDKNDFGRYVTSSKKRETTAKYRKLNPEKQTEYSRRYRESPRGISVRHVYRTSYKYSEYKSRLKQLPEYRKRHSEYTRCYQVRNIEWYRDYQMRYREANRERLREWQKQYNRKRCLDPEYLMKCRLHYYENKELYMQNQRNRRLRQKIFNTKCLK